MKSENDQLGERIATLENIVRELMTRFSSLGLGNMASAAGGGAAIGGPVGCVELPEPTPRTAFAVRWNAETEKWFMYLPGDCLLCDGEKPGGIFDTGEEYDIPDGWTGIGIRATWTVNKKTGEVTNPNADISQSLESKGKVTESTSTYSIEYNFPVAKIVDNEVIQITSGFVSLESHIPTKDGKLTIKDSAGNELGTFTANQESDVTITVSSKNPNDGKLKVKFGEYAAVDKFSANQQGDSTLEFAKVASTGSYGDLKDTPTIPAAANDGKLKVKFGSDEAVDKFSANQQGDSTLEFAKVASTGSYYDLSDKPTPLTGTIEYIPKDGIRYDVSTCQIQVKFNTLNLSTGEHTIGDTWVMITGGQAVPLTASSS